eukprot:s6736_g3.t1
MCDHATLQDAVENGIDLSSNAFMLIHGWTAGALLLDFVESLLEPLQRRPMTDMCDELGAKAGPLRALLRACQILNYVSLDKSTGAYAAVPGLELEELQSVLRRGSMRFILCRWSSACISGGASRV